MTAEQLRPMAERPLVYVAGPYSYPDPERNTAKTLVTAMRLQNSHLVTCVVPHLNLFWDKVLPEAMRYEYWLDYDIALLGRCDAMLRLPGYSVGADAEEEWANNRMIPVFHTEHAMLDWAEKWLAHEDQIEQTPITFAEYVKGI